MDSMSGGKVGIYMCCYNHEKYVAEAIESIIEQTYDNWELWIANDGSTDSSASIIATFQDERIHFYDFKENTRLVGVQSFLLDLIEKSDCDYIVGTSSDDKWKPNRLEKQVSVMDKYTEFGACFSWDEVIYEKSIENTDYIIDNIYSHFPNNSKHAWIEKILLNTNCFNACSAMVRKNLFFQVGGYNQYYIKLGDYRLWLNILENSPIYMCEEPLVYYRRHESNISNLDAKGSVELINEDLCVRRDFFYKYEMDDFFKSFYKYLIYEVTDSFDYEVDKIYFFSCFGKDNRYCYSQISIEQWLKCSDDRNMMSSLKNKYGFDNLFFDELKGNCGVGVLLGQLIPNGEELFSFNEPTLSEIFIDKYLKEGFNHNSIRQYICNPYYILARDSLVNEDKSRIFEQMSIIVNNVRREILKAKNEKIMHIICEKSYKECVESFINEFRDEYIIYISFVSKRNEYFLVNQDNKDMSEVDYYIELYDKCSHGLHFDKEIGIRADVIYYIDCLGDEYECTDMIRGYNLGITQMAMIDRNKFKDQAKLKALELTIVNVVYI